MSMPTFPKNDPPLTREGSLNEIISSIAAEELSLSHLLNVEGEKLQYVLGTMPGLDGAASLDEVMQVNKSVKDTLSGIMEQQMALTSKLGAVLKAPTLPGPEGPMGAEGPEGPEGPAEGEAGPTGPTGAYNKVQLLPKNNTGDIVPVKAYLLYHAAPKVAALFRAKRGV